MGNKLTDALIATGKGAVSLFPGGGFLAEYISLAQGYVADKRMNEWKQRVEEILEKIPRSIDELAQDEAFYSCVQVATMGAMRTYQKEKQELFANALYSSANNIDIPTDKKLFYLSLLGSYTLSHIMLLKYFAQDNYNENVIKRSVLWSSIFVTLMANKIGGLQFGIYRNCQISSRVFHTAVAALPLTKANRSDFE